MHVYERSAALSSRGGTIRLDADAQDALAELGVHDEVEATAIRNKRFDTLSNGKLLHQTVYTLENRQHLISISRDALQKILADAAGTGVKWGMFQSPESASWISTNGRVVLLDDAAHAMAPFTGQGAGSAIQDGLCLGTLLADSGPAVSALRKYEQVRKPVCETAIQRAYSRGMHITAHGLTRRFVDTMTRRIGRSVSRHARKRLQATLQVGARMTEKIDGLLDRARSVKAT